MWWDIQLHQAPVLIEADGNRHHAAPAARARDAIRDAAHEAAGYRVFRFSGTQINTDAVACIQQVISACGLVADREPVFRIRESAPVPNPIPWAERTVVLACEYCGGEFEVRNDHKRRFCTTKCSGLWQQESGIRKGTPKAAEHRVKIGHANRRRVWTPEARSKISAAHKGKVSPNRGHAVPAEVRAKISASLMGHQDSDETRARKSAAHLGKKRDPETRAKISAALRGKPKGAEHRAALSASRKRSSQIKIESDPA